MNATPEHSTFRNGMIWNGTIAFPCERGLGLNQAPLISGSGDFQSLDIQLLGSRYFTSLINHHEGAAFMNQRYCSAFEYTLVGKNLLKYIMFPILEPPPPMIVPPSKRFTCFFVFHTITDYKIAFSCSRCRNFMNDPEGYLWLAKIHQGVKGGDFSIRF